MIGRRGSSSLLGLVIVALAGCAPWTGEAARWAPEQQQLTHELAGLARPLVTHEGALDLGPLWAQTQDARVVGLGEACRHVHAFKGIVHAMTRRAEAEGRPLIVALDLPFSTGLELDAWVGDAWHPPDPAVRRRSLGRSMRFDPQRPGPEGEHVELLWWLREHNEAAGPGRAVRVVGLGGCADWSCSMWLLRYFEAVDPEHGEAARRLFAWSWDGGPAGRRAEAEEAGALLGQVQEQLVAGRDAYVAARGAAAHASALRVVWSMGRALAGADPAETMAGNVAWLAEQSPEARILVVSRNAQIDRASAGPAPTMGAHLTERFGDDYVAVHMTFDHGTFVAPRGPSRVAMNRTGWAPAGTLEAALRRDGGAYMLDVRRAAADSGPLARYLRQSHWTRAYPDVWHVATNDRPAAWSSVVPAADFDLLVVVPDVHIAR